MGNQKRRFSLSAVSVKGFLSLSRLVSLLALCLKLAQPVPQFHHAQGGIAAAHVPDYLQFRFGVLVGMTVGPPGLAGQ